MRHSLSQLSAVREQGEDETSPDAPETESLGADFSKSVRVVMPGGGNACSSPPRQRCGGVVQGPWKGTRYTHGRSYGIPRGSGTLKAKFRFVAVANFLAIQHRADSSLTRGCTCGDGVMQTHSRILNAEEAIWRGSP